MSFAALVVAAKHIIVPLRISITYDMKIICIISYDCVWHDMSECLLMMLKYKLDFDYHTYTKFFFENGICLNIEKFVFALLIKLLKAHVGKPRPVEC